MPKKPDPAPKAKPEPKPAAKPKASTYRTPSGLTQTPCYLSDRQRQALYQRAHEESVAAGKRVSISDVMRQALNAHLGLRDGDE